MKTLVFALLFAFSLTLAVPVISEFTATNVVYAGPRHGHHKHSTSHRKKDVHVKGYTTKKGKHVKPHWRSHPHKK